MKKKVVIALCLVIITTCQTLFSNDNVKDEIPTIEVSNLTLFHSEKGVTKVKVHTKKALRYKNNNIILPTGLNAVLYDNEQAEQVHLTADYLIYIAAEKICKLQGNILIKSCQAHQQLYTSELNYNIVTEEFYTDSPVTLDDKQNILRGNGLKATKDLTHYTIINPRGNMDVQDEN